MILTFGFIFIVGILFGILLAINFIKLKPVG